MGCQSRRNIFVHAALRWITFEAITEIFTETMLTVLVEGKLARRQQSNLVYRINAALCVDVKSAYLVDLITEQVHAIGHRTAHWKEIDQTTSHSEFAGRHHLRGVGVSGEREIATEAFEIKTGFNSDKKRMPGEIFARAQTCHRGGDRDDADVELRLRKMIQRCQAF